MPADTSPRSLGDQCRERTFPLWTRMIAIGSKVYELKTWMVLELMAAKHWPPLEKRHSRQALMGNSLTGRMSSIRRFMSRSLSDWPTRMWRPEGWNATEN